jgi:serine/threonine protein phosphatase PrpC
MPSKKLNQIFVDTVGSTTSSFEWNEYKVSIFHGQNHSGKGNEDCIFVADIKHELVAGVCDGAGGHPRARDAAFNATNTLLEAINHGHGKIHAIELANDSVVDMKSGSHTTLSFVTIKNDHLHCYNVGDSEILYWNTNDSLYYSNIPHSDVGHKIQAGVLEQKKSLEDPNRYSVNNLLGDETIRIEATSKMLLKKGHTILIGSDGIFDNIPHQELTDLLSGGSYEESFDTLVKRCQDRGDKWLKDDDISFVLIRKLRANNQ